MYRVECASIFFPLCLSLVYSMLQFICHFSFISVGVDCVRCVSFIKCLCTQQALFEFERKRERENGMTKKATGSNPKRNGKRRIKASERKCINDKDDNEGDCRVCRVKNARKYSCRNQNMSFYKFCTKKRRAHTHRFTKSEEEERERQR